MNTCEFCEYFERFGVHSEEGQCSNIKVVGTSGVSWTSRQKEVNGITISSNEWVDAQVSPSGADVETVTFTKDFGCIHHECKHTEEE